MLFLSFWIVHDIMRSLFHVSSLNRATYAPLLRFSSLDVALRMLSVVNRSTMLIAHSTRG